MDYLIVALIYLLDVTSDSLLDPVLTGRYDLSLQYIYYLLPAKADRTIQVNLYRRDSRILLLSVKKCLKYICTLEYYSAIKGNKVMPFAATWMGLESVIVSEV